MLVLVLLIINWGLEITKWTLLIKTLQKITPIQAFHSICLGLTMALLTPNRIGEFGGRLLYINKGNRIPALYYHSFMSMAQLLVSILFGLIGVAIFVEEILFINISSNWVWIIIVLINITLLFVYFSSKLLNKGAMFFSKKFSNNAVKEINNNQRFSVLVLSLLRYLVFTSQFCIIIYLIDPHFKLHICFFGMSIVFLATAIIPTGWISDLPVKSSMAFYIFSLLNYDGTNALIGTIILWIINLLLPASIGLWNLKKINWLEIKQALRT